MIICDICKKKVENVHPTFYQPSKEVAKRVTHNGETFMAVVYIRTPLSRGRASRRRREPKPHVCRACVKVLAEKAFGRKK